MLNSPKFSNAILKQLEKICGPENVSLKENDRIAYSRDCATQTLLEANRSRILYPPDVVVWPRNTQEVAQVLKLADRQQIPIVPYGAGSGVCGGAIPLKAGIILDLKKLDQLISIDPQSLTVTAQCGILGEILERKLQQAGYTLGHFPSSIYTSTLGGFLACRSAGQLSTKYGKIEDMIQSFTVCLANGKILKIGDHNALNLKELFVGSEGTLGAMTEATLKIHPLAEKQYFCGIEFPSVEAGLTAIRKFMQQGLKPAVVRLYDPLDSLMFSMHSDSGVEKHSLKDMLFENVPGLQKGFHQLKSLSMQTVISHSRLTNWLIDTALKKSLLILGFEGAGWKVDSESKATLQICQAQSGKNLGEKPGQRWLKRRYAVSYRMSPMIDQGYFVDTMEVAAPWHRIEELYHGVRRVFQDRALIMAHFSHVYSDGASIYFTFAGYRPTADENIKTHQTLWHEAMQASLKHGSTTSHHHGIGFLKVEGFKKEMGPWMDWFQIVKNTLDPKGVLNPGKMGLS